MYQKILISIIFIGSYLTLNSQCITDISDPISGNALVNEACINQVQISATYCCTDNWSTECQKLYEMCTGVNVISAFIHIDQFGYQPEDSKIAVLSNPQTGFNSFLSYAPSSNLEVIRSTDEVVVFTSSASPFDSGAEQAQSGDQGWWFDFSEVITPGSYYIFDPINNQRSAEFEIKTDVYHEVLKHAGRMFYYNRDGIAKEAQYAGTEWQDDLAFDGPGQQSNCYSFFDQENPELAKDLSGGWYDAGDFNKYVTFANGTLHTLMWAYIDNPNAFNDNWDIPESGNGVPDIIDEIKWELDWLLKMNNEDGTTHLKMGSSDYNQNILVPPSLNTDPFFYIGTCTSASLAVSSVFAQAAKLFRQFPLYEEYSEILETRAIAAANYVLPFLQNNELDENCDNGEVVAGDADWSEANQKIVAVISAIYLYDLTNDENYNLYIIDNIEDTENPDNDSPWSFYRPYYAEAKLHYLTLENANPEVSNLITNSFQSILSSNPNDIYGTSNTDLYRAQMPTWAYHAGSNFTKSGVGILNILAAKSNLNPSQNDDYRQKAKNVINYIHGVNPLGITYLTNMYEFGADRCSNETAHEWFQPNTPWSNSLSSTFGPPPGYLVGGPVAQFDNYQGEESPSPPANQPAQKGFWAFNDYTYPSWAITECAIYYQAAYIRVLAEFTENNSSTWVDKFTGNSPKFSVNPNPSKNEIYLASEINSGSYKIFTSDGTEVKVGEYIDSLSPINISQLIAGVYFISLKNNKGKGLGTSKFLKL